MAEPISNINEFPNGDLTDIVYEDLCYGDIFYDEEFDLEDIHVALDLDARPVFLEGVISRLQYIGFDCDYSDTNTILTEIKRRYKDILGIACPRTVQEWIRGTTPGVTERKNNYDLCYALEMNLKDTAEFFLKHYLTLPFNYKDKTDAIFFYCLYHNHPYSVVKQLLDAAATFESQETSHTATLQIGRHLTTITSTEEFLEYLSRHCYGNEQQYQVARKRIQDLASKHSYKSIADLHEQLMGFKYQEIKRQKWKKVKNLPKRFTESLPTDGVLSKVLAGERETYETLRKTLIILKLFDFYPPNGREDTDDQSIRDDLYDFYDEVNEALALCGFSQLYMRHPFDWLIIFCANSPDPIGHFLDLSRMRYQEPT